MRGCAVSGLQRQGKLGNDKEGKPKGSTLMPRMAHYATLEATLSLLGHREVDRCPLGEGALSLPLPALGLKTKE